MRNIVAIAVAGLMEFAALPAFAQIAHPDLTQPPCSGQRCYIRQRGATVQHPADQRTACPAGTVYDAYKGVCRVVPGAR